MKILRDSNNFLDVIKLSDEVRVEAHVDLYFNIYF
jgi:hypothetical protein